MVRWRFDGASIRRVWQTFLDLADRLEIPVRRLLREDVRFSAMETAGHQLGRSVAQITTERLAFERAERLTGPQPCPTYQRMCPLIHEQRGWWSDHDPGPARRSSGTGPKGPNGSSKSAPPPSATTTDSVHGSSTAQAPTTTAHPPANHR